MAAHNSRRRHCGDASKNKNKCHAEADAHSDLRWFRQCQHRSNVKPDPSPSGHVENRDGTRVQNHVWILTPKKIRPNVACKCHHHHRRTCSGSFQELDAFLKPKAPSLSAPWSVAFVREGSDGGCATIRLISRALGDAERHLCKGETCAKAKRRSEYNHVDPQVSREARRGGEAHETRRDPAHHSPNSNDE